MSIRHSFRNAFIATACSLFGLMGANAGAAEYSLSIQPLSSPERTLEVYQPLADYLSEQTGHNIRLVTEKNFFSYWINMRKEQPDLVLDAAHFTDYRLKHLDYSLLAKLPEEVSYSLVTSSENLILDPRELIGRKVASLHAPGLGAIRLTDIFDNPMQQPVMVYVDDTEQALKCLAAGKVDAVIIPSRLAREQSDINIISYTQSVPAPALSASSRVPNVVQNSIKQALLSAVRTPSGRQMLEQINFSTFEAATAGAYDGYALLLQDAYTY